MIVINKNTNIYIACPPASSSGGPELLHQLAYHLKSDIGIDNVYMYYYPSDYPNPIHPSFTEYKVKFVNHIEDDNCNLLIVPENIKAIDLLAKYSNIRKVVWWLSVDNFYLGYIFKYKY